MMPAANSHEDANAGMARLAAHRRAAGMEVSPQLQEAERAAEAAKRAIANARGPELPKGQPPAQNATAADAEATARPKPARTPVERAPNDASSDVTDAHHGGSRIKLLRGDAIKPEPVHWLWGNWLAAGKFHILAGNPGTGKTTAALAFAATVTRGALWPDGTHAPVGDVLIWSGEDDPKDTLVPRLRAMDADMKRIRFVAGVRDNSGTRSFDPARDMGQLQHEAATIGNVRLLIVDPVVSAVNGDSHKNAETRRSLQPLVDLAAALDCAVLGIHHLSKGTSGRDPIERVTGSIAFGALARVVMVTAESPQEHERPASRILAIAKSNIGQDVGGFYYDLEQVELAHFPGVFASAVVWKGATEGTARELLAEAEPIAQPGGKGEPRDPSMTAQAIEFLKHVLKETRLLSKEVKTLATAEGISERALRVARQRLGIGIERVGFGRDTKSYWTLPTASFVTSNPIYATPKRDVTNGSNGTNGASPPDDAGCDPSSADASAHKPAGGPIAEDF